MDLSSLKEFITPENIETGVKFITGMSTTNIIKNSKTFNNIWDITIGNKLEALHQKSIFKNQQDVEKYKNQCLQEISDIPFDKIQDPKLSIIGPALEASKYYIEEEEIRTMFAKLIASSMNSDFEDIPHSFVEIIKQLSPYDAKLFQSLSSLNETLVEFILENDNGTNKKLLEDVHISQNFKDYNKNSISLINLQKQGLIKIMYDSSIYETSFYEIYNPIYVKLEKNSYDLIYGLPPKITMKKHSFKLTNLGKQFKLICCKSSK